MIATLGPMPERSLTMSDLMNQLRAEIGDVFDGNYSAFARATGINRSQLLLYVSAERDMGLDRLMVCIAALGLTEPDFFDRARVRAAADRTPTGDSSPEAQPAPQ